MAGFDTSEPLSLQTREAIEAALLRHHVLVFHDQGLTNESMHRFAESFGELEGNVLVKPDGSMKTAVHPISNLDASGQPSADPYIKSNYSWHSDKAYLPVPSWITMLFAVEIPETGGDTQFANVEAAYEALDGETKARIANLRVINSFEYMLDTTGSSGKPENVTQKVPPVEHPLVRTHPRTGAKSLYVTMYAMGIKDMPGGEARELLDRLLEHATQPQFVYTLQWRQHDLVMWDNRSLVHRAIPNFDMMKQRRTLLRVVVRGT
jgi:taurine dioxygenase